MSRPCFLTPVLPALFSQAELIVSQREAQRAALEQMAARLSSLRYPSPTSRRHCGQLARSNRY